MQRFVIQFVLGCFVFVMVLVAGGFTQPAIAASMTNIDEIGLCADGEQQIDLNNANLKAFTDCPGFYPNLAAKILQNGPFEKVEDVLRIPDLTDQQKALLKANLKAFTAGEPTVPLVKRMPPRLTLPAH